MTKVRNEKYLKALGKHVRKTRRAAGMSQEELSLSSEVSLPQITRIERGTINPSVSTIYALAKAMNIHPREMYDFEFK